MHYDNYTPEDFLKDDDFIQWVKNPTDAQIFFWENWVATHPEKVQTVAKARYEDGVGKYSKGSTK